MSDTNKIISDLNESTEKLLASLSGFSPEDFNRRAAENCWSAGDIAEHLFLLETMINKTLTQPAAATDRPAGHKIKMIETGLLDMGKKYLSPEFIRSSATDKNQREMIQKLQSQRQALVEIIRQANLAEIPPVKHPNFGNLTRLEWIYFNLYHTQRHLQQLEYVRDQLSDIRFQKSDE